MKKILLVALAFCWLNCSGDRESEYNINFPISDQTVISPDKFISFRIPYNWHAANDESVLKDALICLIKDDFSASMIVTEIKTPFNVRELIEEKGLEVLGNISFEMKKNSSKDSLILVSPPAKFVLNKKGYCAYEYYVLNSKGLIRIVIIDSGFRYYEFMVIPNFYDPIKRRWTADSLFSIQQTVLKTFKWR